MPTTIVVVQEPGRICSVCRVHVDAALLVRPARTTATAHLLLCKSCGVRIGDAARSTL